VLDQISGHHWHVRWFPSEDVSVIPEEADERVFQFRVKARPDHGGLPAVTCPEIDWLDLYLFGWLRFVGLDQLLWDVEFTWGKLL
jgi:hypothetical protein